MVIGIMPTCAEGDISIFDPLAEKLDFNEFGKQNEGEKTWVKFDDDFEFFDKIEVDSFSKPGKIKSKRKSKNSRIRSRSLIGPRDYNIGGFKRTSEARKAKSLPNRRQHTVSEPLPLTPQDPNRNSSESTSDDFDFNSEKVFWATINSDSLPEPFEPPESSISGDYSDSDANDKFVKFDDATETWSECSHRKRNRRPAAPLFKGKSVSSDDLIDARFRQLGHGVKVVDKERVMCGRRLIFLMRSYFRNDALEKIEFIFENTSDFPVVVGIRVFKHGPNVFWTPAGDEVDFRKFHVIKWKLEPKTKMYCMKAERDPTLPQTNQPKNKMGFSFTTGYKSGIKWLWR
eukprot:216289_1